MRVYVRMCCMCVCVVCDVGGVCVCLWCVCVCVVCVWCVSGECVVCVCGVYVVCVCVYVWLGGRYQLIM